MIQVETHTKRSQQGFTLIDQSAKRGFTLIELSIVLVIIGLIVGGVLVGQDLIKGAEIRATVSQIEKYDAAANTFRGKYNGFPGDMLSPGNFFSGLTTTATSPDGDGMIEANGHASGVAGGYGAESALFWGELSRANLISDATTTIVSFSGNAAVGTIGDGHMPRTKMGSGRIHIGSYGGANYYMVIAMDGTTDVTVNTGQIDAQHALTPNEAFQVDTKLDDGLAATGRVVSIAEDVAISAVGGGQANPSTSGVTSCYATGTGYYNTGTAPNAVLCSLRIQTSF